MRFESNTHLKFLTFYCSVFVPVNCRWETELNPGNRRGPWTEKEDDILLNAHAKFGRKWARIARLLPGRYVTVCRVSVECFGLLLAQFRVQLSATVTVCFEFLVYKGRK